jgi:hypothetical protein
VELLLLLLLRPVAAAAAAASPPRSARRPATLPAMARARARERWAQTPGAIGR